MKRTDCLRLSVLLSFILLLLVLTAAAQKAPRKLDLYLLIGQSNMAGRGAVDSLSNAPAEGIWVITADDKWIPAKDPLHFDKPGIAGVGPGLSFAKQVHAAHPSRPIGLIPCAVGGSGIDDWQAGREHKQTGIYPYDAMKARVQKARKNGRIKAILWHQGETDSPPEKNVVYEEKLASFFDRLRKELKVRKAPILIGTLGDFFIQKSPGAATINQIVLDFPRRHPGVYAVSAAGLTHKGDGTHFDTPSAQELGKRYAEVFLKNMNK